MIFSTPRLILLAAALVAFNAAYAAPISAALGSSSTSFGSQSAHLYQRTSDKNVKNAAPDHEPKAKAAPAPKAKAEPAPNDKSRAPAVKASSNSTKDQPANMNRKVSSTHAQKCKGSNKDGCPFTTAPGVKFELNGTQGKLGQRLGSSVKAEVWDVDTWQGQPQHGMVLKVFRAPLFFKQREVDGLKDAGLLVDSGKIGKTKVIAMHKAHGESLKKIFDELKHDKGKIEQFMAPLRPKIAHEVAQIAKQHGVYHNNLNSGNIFIDRQSGNAITLIKWGKALMKGERGFLDDEKKILQILQKNLKSSS